MYAVPTNQIFVGTRYIASGISIKFWADAQMSESTETHFQQTNLRQR